MTSFLGIDIGTSSIKAVLIDERQGIIAEASRPIDVLRPHPLWSEQDPEAWWQATLWAVERLCEKAPDAWRALRAIGFAPETSGAALLAERRHRMQALYRA